MSADRMAQLRGKGWVKLPKHPRTLAWVEAAGARARAALRDPDHMAQWQCEGTWFVGVDVLDNDRTGAVDGVPLDGPGPDLARRWFGPLDLHRAQISAVRPGYPKPRAGESDAAFRYRVRRDAAHVDGLLPMGPQRRRVLGEPHAWILGLPLTPSLPDAAPLVVWEGSHKLLGTVLSEALRAHPQETWGEVDLTEVYQATRRHVFDTCLRRKLSAQPGEALLLHRHVLHGIAPWDAPAGVDDPRVIAYFRPQFQEDWARWLSTAEN